MLQTALQAVVVRYQPPLGPGRKVDSQAPPQAPDPHPAPLPGRSPALHFSKSSR